MKKSKTIKIDIILARKINELLCSAHALVFNLEDEGTLGMIQRAALSSDIRTTRNLRYLKRNLRRTSDALSELVLD